MRFTKDDDRVFAAFLAQRPAEGRKFSTDGRRLDGGMYLSNVASWEMGPRGVEIPVLHDLGSRTAQQIHRRLRKMGGPIVKHEWEIRHTGHRGAERRRGSRVAEGFAGDPPTAKNILEWLGPYMEHEGLDAPRESARLARLIANARTNRQAEEVLEEVNRVINAHGVEAIRIEGAYIDGYYFDIVATYVNTGDTYNATLLHESATGRFVLTTWGDWFEANEREYLPEEEEEEDDDDLEEARRRTPSRTSRPYFSPARGEDDNYGYAVKIDGINNDFPSQPFGRRIEAMEAVKAFKAVAQREWISTKRRKGQRPLAELKRWISAVKPSQFYARWTTDTDDDSMEVWYTL